MIYTNRHETPVPTSFSLLHPSGTRTTSDDVAVLESTSSLNLSLAVDMGRWDMDHSRASVYQPRLPLSLPVISLLDALGVPMRSPLCGNYVPR